MASSHNHPPGENQDAYRVRMIYARPPLALCPGDHPWSRRDGRSAASAGSIPKSRVENQGDSSECAAEERGGQDDSGIQANHEILRGPEDVQAAFPNRQVNAGESLPKGDEARGGKRGGSRSPVSNEERGRKRARSPVPPSGAYIEADSGSDDRANAAAHKRARSSTPDPPQPSTEKVGRGTRFTADEEKWALECLERWKGQKPGIAHLADFYKRLGAKTKRGRSWRSWRNNLEKIEIFKGLFWRSDPEKGHPRDDEENDKESGQNNEQHDHERATPSSTSERPNGLKTPMPPPAPQSSRKSPPFRTEDENWVRNCWAFWRDGGEDLTHMEFFKRIASRAKYHTYESWYRHFQRGMPGGMKELKEWRLTDDTNSGAPSTSSSAVEPASISAPASSSTSSSNTEYSGIMKNTLGGLQMGYDSDAPRDSLNPSNGSLNPPNNDGWGHSNNGGSGSYSDNGGSWRYSNNGELTDHTDGGAPSTSSPAVEPASIPAPASFPTSSSNTEYRGIMKNTLDGLQMGYDSDAPRDSLNPSNGSLNPPNNDGWGHSNNGGSGSYSNNGGSWSHPNNDGWRYSNNDGWRHSNNDGWRHPNGGGWNHPNNGGWNHPNNGNWNHPNNGNWSHPNNGGNWSHPNNDGSWSYSNNGGSWSHPNGGGTWRHPNGGEDQAGTYLEFMQSSSLI